MIKVNTFETERLIFRRWQELDSMPFYKMNSDPDVMEYFPKTLSRTESDSLIERIENSFEDRGYGLWALELKDNKAFIGFLGFNFTDLESDFTPCIEIGWRIDKNYWGKGYATEGASKCLEVGFNTFFFQEIYSFTSKENTRSEKVMKRIGLTYVKEFNHPRIDENHWLCRHVLYRLKKDEFEKMCLTTTST